MSDQPLCSLLNIPSKTDISSKETLHSNKNILKHQKEEEFKTELECPECKEKYDSKSSFIEHLQGYPGKLRNCINCQNVFQNSLAFKFHKQLSMCVGRGKLHQCTLCTKKLLGESQYINHVRAHKRNQCQICGDHFSRRKHLEIHRASVHNASPSESYRCQWCDKEFWQKRSLLHHYKVTHPDNGLVCSVCLQRFESDAQLEAHLDTHKSSTKESLTCDKCGEQFSRRHKYLLHLKSHEKYKCEGCLAGFSAKKQALSHARSTGHRVPGLGPQLQCCECGELFFCRDTFNTHMLLHAGGNGLYCAKCKKHFSRERYYKLHLQTQAHLAGEGGSETETLLACDVCSKTFSNKNNLRVHKYRVHRAGLRLHSCTYCPFKSKLLANLKRHVALHTEQPRFVCDECGAQLQTSHSLRDHQERLHSHNNKVWTCDKCGSSFRGSSDLKKHLATTHAEVPSHVCHCGNRYKSLYNLKRHQLMSHTVPLRQNLTPEKSKLKAPKKTVKKKTSKDVHIKLRHIQPKPSVDPSNSSEVAGELNTVLVLAESQAAQDLAEAPYSIDFTTDKPQIMYADGIDMSNLQVVESVMQMSEDADKTESGVLINVGNLLSHPLASDYVMPETLETSPMVNVLGNSLSVPDQLVDVGSEKQDIVLGLHQYVLSHDLNFLSVE